MNQRAWFGPEIAVSTSSRLVETALQIAYSRRATAPLPHSKQYRTVLLPYCARRADTGDTRALASPLRMARQRGSRQGSHARAPAHQPDHSTWRGSEEADKARMRALPLTSPTTPPGEAARKPVNCTPVDVNCTRPYPRPRWASVLPRANQWGLLWDTGVSREGRRWQEVRQVVRWVRQVGGLRLQSSFE